MTPHGQKKHVQTADPRNCDDDDDDERQQQQQSSSSTEEDNNINIDRLVAQRTQYRKEQKWKEADEIKAALEHDLLLQHDCTIELIDRSDGSSSWRKIVHHEKETAQPVKIIQWSRMNVTRSPIPSSPTNNINDTESSAVDIVPLILVTVDAPHYRERLGETLQHLKEICDHSDDKTRFGPEPVDMLDLAKHPLLNSKRILFEGWRTILLPHLLHRHENRVKIYNRTKSDDGFALVAEDDVRFPPKWTPDRIRTECLAAFRSNPDVHVLSMGHNWSALRPNRQQRRRQKKRSSRRSNSKEGSNDQEIIPASNDDEHRPCSLLQHLQKNGGIHASTLLAIRSPEGIQHLFDALNDVTRNKKKTHLDQYLFLSTLHNVGLALSDPPLVGWSEVSMTLTSAGPGQRRRDGGRLGQLPVQNENGDEHVEWVQRKLVTMKKSSHHHGA